VTEQGAQFPEARESSHQLQMRERLLDVSIGSCRECSTRRGAEFPRPLRSCR